MGRGGDLECSLLVLEMSSHSCGQWLAIDCRAFLLTRREPVEWSAAEQAELREGGAVGAVRVSACAGEQDCHACA